MSLSPQKWWLHWPIWLGAIGKLLCCNQCIVKWKPRAQNQWEMKRKWFLFTFSFFGLLFVAKETATRWCESSGIDKHKRINEHEKSGKRTVKNSNGSASSSVDYYVWRRWSQRTVAYQISINFPTLALSFVFKVIPFAAIGWEREKRNWNTAMVRSRRCDANANEQRICGGERNGKRVDGKC